jgi:ribosomal protein S18 acetylase RimI-like enzyme
MRHNPGVDTFRDIRIVDALPGDGGALLAVQRRAFAPAAERYGRDDLPPLIETTETIEADIREQVVLKAVDDAGEVVGAVRGARRDECVYVGRLVVDPGVQRSGIATTLMLALEERFPEAACFELFTGGMNEPGMGLYLKLGYREVRRERIDERLEIVFLRKERAPAGPMGTAAGEET